MRYYEYLSTTKVEMLYPQIDRTSRATGGEVGIDLTVFKATRKTDGIRPLTVHDKLTAVEEWIYAHEPVGTPDEPDVWIYGRADLLATTLTLTDESDDPGPVLFTPSAGEGTDLLMGGSSRNSSSSRAYPDMPLPPQLRSHSSPVSMSATLAALADDLEIPASSDDAGHGRVIAGLAEWIRANDGRPAEPPRTLGFRVSPPVRLGECEFLAKRLRTAKHKSRPATLATPLFVALLD